MTAPYTTTDINLAAYLLYSGVEPVTIGIQNVGRGQTKAILHYRNSDVQPYLETFYTEPTTTVELQRYNRSRAEIMRRINITKGKNNER